MKGPDAEKRVIGEFASMTEIHKTVPSLVPQPRGHGKCVDSDGFYFFCDYKEIDHRAPDPVRLGERVSELHLKSMGKSPIGKFGTSTVPYDGKLPLLGEWDDSWLSYFTKLIRLAYQHDVAVNGHWQELDKLMEIVLTKLIPRLLGPLEGNIQPCLIHGDLWEENIGTDINTNELYIFDAAAYYAHNEKEIGIWRCDHHQMKSKEYLKEYFRHIEPDEPAEEFEDRQLLYSVQTKFMKCGHMPGTIVRSQLAEDLKFLVRKYLDDTSGS